MTNYVHPIISNITVWIEIFRVANNPHFCTGTCSATSCLHHLAPVEPVTRLDHSNAIYNSIILPQPFSQRISQVKNKLKKWNKWKIYYIYFVTSAQATTSHEAHTVKNTRNIFVNCSHWSRQTSMQDYNCSSTTMRITDSRPSLYFRRRRHGILFPVVTRRGVACPPYVYCNVIGRDWLVGSQWDGATVGCKEAVSVAWNRPWHVIASTRRGHWNASYITRNQPHKK